MNNGYCAGMVKRRKSTVAEEDVDAVMTGKRQRKVAITLRLDSEVLAWARSFGKGYQTRLNDLLRLHMERMQAKG